MNYYESSLNESKLDLIQKKIFYNKIDFFSKEPKSVSIEDKLICPVCKEKKIKVTSYKDSIAALENWSDGINSTVYYIQTTQYFCLNCNLEWKKYKNWEEREFEYPG